MSQITLAKRRVKAFEIANLFIENEIEKIDDNTFLISGKISVNELKKVLGIEVPEGEYETLSGYLLEILGRVPEDDEKPIIETDKVTYKIEEYEDKRILWVKACKTM